MWHFSYTQAAIIKLEIEKGPWSKPGFPNSERLSPNPFVWKILAVTHLL
jgi:hypothetical protein